MAGDAEVEAMTGIVTVLGDLDEESRARVLRWAAERYGVQLGQGKRDRGSKGAALEYQSEEEFEDVASLYDAANPHTDAEKAIVVGYWFQVVEGRNELGSQEINTQLKHLGHGVKNITSALTDLMQRKPRLVIQVQKSGRTQQARKKYKITTEGLKFVRRLIAGEDD